MISPVSIAHLYLADGFYGSLKDFFEKMGDANAYDELAQVVATDYTKQQVIAARIFGIAFGITVVKAADVSNKKIKKTSVKKYLDSCKFDDAYKSEISNAASIYINFEQDELFGARSEAGFVSRDLGKLAYSLLDMKLSKGNFADPTHTTHMAAAIALAYREIVVDDSLVSVLQQEGLIS